MRNHVPRWQRNERNATHDIDRSTARINSARERRAAEQAVAQELGYDPNLDLRAETSADVGENFEPHEMMHRGQEVVVQRTRGSMRNGRGNSHGRSRRR